MAKWEKLLSRMRENPKDDWKIEQIATVCNHFEAGGLLLMTPKRGSHYTLTHPAFPDVILTIPAHNPIKAIYVKQFVSMMGSIIALEEGE